MKIALKQIYLPCCEEDGERYLVDRLWPRGMSKAKADLTGWNMKTVPDRRYSACAISMSLKKALILLMSF